MAITKEKPYLYEFLVRGNPQGIQAAHVRYGQQVVDDGIVIHETFTDATAVDPGNLELPLSDFVKSHIGQVQAQQAQIHDLQDALAVMERELNATRDALSTLQRVTAKARE